MNKILDTSKLALVISGTKAGARAIFLENIEIDEILDIRLYRANRYSPCYSYQRLGNMHCYSVYHKVNDYMNRTGYWAVSIYLSNDYSIESRYIIELLNKISGIFQSEYIDTVNDKILDIRIKPEHFSSVLNNSYYGPVKHNKRIYPSQAKNGFFVHEDNNLSTVLADINPQNEPELDFLLLVNNSHKEEYEKLSLLPYYPIPSQPRNISLAIVFKCSGKAISNLQPSFKIAYEAASFREENGHYIIDKLSNRDSITFSLFSQDYELLNPANTTIHIKDLSNYNKIIELKEILKPKELIISFPKDEMESLRGKSFYVNGNKYTVEMPMMPISGRFFLEDSVTIKFDDLTAYKSSSNTIFLNSYKLSNSGIVIKFSEYFFKNDITKPPTGIGGQTTDPKAPNKEGENSKWKSIAFYAAAPILLIFIIVAVYFIVASLTKTVPGSNGPVSTQGAETNTVKYKIICETCLSNKFDYEPKEIELDSISNLTINGLVTSIKKDTIVIKPSLTKKYPFTAKKDAKDTKFEIEVKVKESGNSNDVNPPQSTDPEIGIMINDIQKIIDCVKVLSGRNDITDDRELTEVLADENCVSDLGMRRAAWKRKNNPQVTNKWLELYGILKNRFPKWKS